MDERKSPLPYPLVSDPLRNGFILVWTRVGMAYLSAIQNERKDHS
jgi:hypothetical protein